MSDDYHFYVKKKRPEEIYERASDYFKGETLSWYANSKTIMRIQEKITIRALELLDLKKANQLILDAGCGAGFASIYLKELGHEVVALDIIHEFLTYYEINELNPIRSDMCFSPFRANCFNAIISISALQWVYRESNNKTMKSNLINLARTFYQVLKPDARAIFQFYPKNRTIMKDIGKIISDNTPFTGNFILDNLDNPKKRKIFLLLQK